MDVDVNDAFSFSSSDGECVQDQYLGEALSVYAFLRTMSLPLQLSPFEAETFLRALVPSPLSNILMDEIHLALIRTCAAEVEGYLQPWFVLDWGLLDRVSWPAYLASLLQAYMDMAKSLEARAAESAAKAAANPNSSSIALEMATSKSLYAELPEIIAVHRMLASALTRTAGNYHKLIASEKLQVIQCLITLLLTSELLASNFDARARLEIPPTDESDPLPLFKKGEDGYPEVCILCSELGNLLCCDLCPCSYHQTCLSAHPSIFDGVWECFECTTSDPMRSRSRQQFHSLGNTSSLLVIGRFVMQKKQDQTYRLLERQEIATLLEKCRGEELSQWPWQEFIRAVSRYPFLPVEDSPGPPSGQGMNVSSTDASDLLTSVQSRIRRRGEPEPPAAPMQTATSPTPTKSSTAATPAKPPLTILTPEQIGKSRFLDLNVLPRGLQPEAYINRYRAATLSPYLYTIKDTIAQFRCADLLHSETEWPARASAHPALRSILLGIEALYFRLGPLCGLELWKNPLNPTSFLMSLTTATSLADAKQLLLKLGSNIHISLFSPEWFLSSAELKNLTMGNLAKLDASKSKGLGRKLPLRFHKFTRIDKLLERALSTENFDSHHVRASKKGSKSDVADDEEDGGDDDDDDDEGDEGEDEDALELLGSLGRNKDNSNRPRVEMREEPDGPCLRRFASSADASGRLNLYPESKIMRCARANDATNTPDDIVTAFGFFWFLVKEDGNPDPAPMEIDALIKLTRSRYSMRDKEVECRGGTTRAIDAREMSGGEIIKRFAAGNDVARFLDIAQAGVSYCARKNEEKRTGDMSKFAGIYWTFSSQAAPDEESQDLDMDYLQGIVDRSKMNWEEETEDVKKELAAPSLAKQYGANFCTGKRLIDSNEQPFASPKLIKKLARVGGRALLPHVGYNIHMLADDLTWPLAPLAWYWYQRVSVCKTSEELAIQFRYLEQALRLDELDKRPSPLSVIVNAEEDGMISSTGQPFDYGGDVTASVSNRKSENVPEKKGPLSGYAIWLDITTRALKAVAGSPPSASRYHILSPKIATSNSDDENDKEEVSRIQIVDSAHVSLRALMDYYYRAWLNSVIRKLPDDNCGPLFPTTPMQQLAVFGESVIDILSQGATIDRGHLSVYKDMVSAIMIEREKTIKSLTEMVIKPAGIDAQVPPAIVMKGKSDHILLRIILDLVERTKEAAISTARADLLKQSQSDDANGTKPDTVAHVLSSDALLTASATPAPQVPSSGPGRMLYDCFLHHVFKKSKVGNSVMSQAPHESGLVSLRMLSAEEAKALDRSKCGINAPVEDYYLPQVGDELLYYTDGHQEYSNDYPENSRRGLLKKKNLEKFWVACRILTMDYECRSNILGSQHKGVSMVLQLGVLASSSSEKLGCIKQFTVIYTPAHTCGEFLVTKEKMLATIARDWKVGQPFSTVYNDGTRYSGTIASIDRDENLFPKWNGVKVTWDSDDEPTFLCEWELEPPEEQEASAEVLKNATFIRESINKKLHDVVCKIINAPEYEAFIDDITGKL